MASYTIPISTFALSHHTFLWARSGLTQETMFRTWQVFCCL